MYEAKPGEVDHVLLLYSGGLDTSAMILWLKDKYNAKVSTLTVDLGQGENLELVKKRAIELGASNAFVVDAKNEFVDEYVKPSILANGLYMGVYPLFTALGRPLLAKKAVEFAKKTKAGAIAHGSTGKGNDQVRKEAMILALDPSMKVIAPVRTFKLTRADEAKLMIDHGFEPPGVHKDYSTDENIWGVSFQGSELSDPANSASKKVFSYTKKYFPAFNAPEEAPNKPETVTIGFEKGVPVSINGKKLPLIKLIENLNHLGAKHGVGVIDYVESYIFGHKGREFYINPAASILITAHKDLEHLLLPKTLLKEKAKWDAEWSYLVYHGWWKHQLLKVLQTSIEEANQSLTGQVTVKLYKGSAVPVSRQADSATKMMYNESLGQNGFDELASAGFIELFSLEMRL